MNVDCPLPEYIATAADLRVGDALSRSLRSNCRGLVFFGRPGAGTTSMVRHACRILNTSDGEKVPLLEMANGGQSRSDRVFLACTLRSCGIDFRDGASARQLYPTVIAHARELAAPHSRRRLVLMVDDGQYLGGRSARWIYRLVCDLRKLAVRPMVVLVGGYAPDVVTRSAKSIGANGCVSNLVLKAVEVEGLLSVDEVHESLRQIDDQPEAPIDSSLNHDWMSPRERLASYADTIWRHFETRTPADAIRASVPVSAIASFARVAMTISRAKSRPMSMAEIRSMLEIGQPTHDLPVTLSDADGTLLDLLHPHGVETLHPAIAGL